MSSKRSSRWKQPINTATASAGSKSSTKTDSPKPKRAKKGTASSTASASSSTTTKEIPNTNTNKNEDKQPSKSSTETTKNDESSNNDTVDVIKRVYVKDLFDEEYYYDIIETAKDNDNNNNATESSSSTTTVTTVVNNNNNKRKKKSVEKSTKKAKTTGVIKQKETEAKQIVKKKRNSQEILDEYSGNGNDEYGNSCRVFSKNELPNHLDLVKSVEIQEFRTHAKRAKIPYLPFYKNEECDSCEHPHAHFEGFVIVKSDREKLDNVVARVKQLRMGFVDHADEGPDNPEKQMAAMFEKRLDILNKELKKNRLPKFYDTMKMAYKHSRKHYRQLFNTLFTKSEKDFRWPLDDVAICLYFILNVQEGKYLGFTNIAKIKQQLSQLGQKGYSKKTRLELEYMFYSKETFDIKNKTQENNIFLKETIRALKNSETLKKEIREKEKSTRLYKKYKNVEVIARAYEKIFYLTRYTSYFEESRLESALVARELIKKSSDDNTLNMPDLQSQRQTFVKYVKLVRLFHSLGLRAFSFHELGNKIPISSTCMYDFEELRKELGEEHPGHSEDERIKINSMLSYCTPSVFSTIFEYDTPPTFIKKEFIDFVKCGNGDEDYDKMIFDIVFKLKLFISRRKQLTRYLINHIGKSHARKRLVMEAVYTNEGEAPYIYLSSANNDKSSVLNKLPMEILINISKNLSQLDLNINTPSRIILAKIISIMKKSSNTDSFCIESEIRSRLDYVIKIRSNNQPNNFVYSYYTEMYGTELSSDIGKFSTRPWREWFNNWYDIESSSDDFHRYAFPFLINSLFGGRTGLVNNHHNNMHFYESDSDSSDGCSIM